MSTLVELKSKFSSNYYRAVNDQLTAEEELDVRSQSKLLEDQLQRLMTSDEFETYYQEVHNSAWNHM